MSDVVLFQGPDGGEIQITNGVVALETTPFTAVYLSLFGGNIEDDGTTATEAEQWWGNWDESDPVQHLRSKTQALLVGLPAITSNLVRIEEAAASDLEWMTAEIVDSIEITASIPARNRVRLLVNLTGKDGAEHRFDFSQPWGASSLA